MVYEAILASDWEFGALLGLELVEAGEFIERGDLDFGGFGVGVGMVLEGFLLRVDFLDICIKIVDCNRFLVQNPTIERKGFFNRILTLEFLL